MLWSKSESIQIKSAPNASVQQEAEMEEITDINRELMLDANATAGLLYEIFGTEMTASPAFVKNTLSALFCGPYPCWIITKTAVSPAVRTLRCMQGFYRSR